MNKLQSLFSALIPYKSLFFLLSILIITIFTNLLLFHFIAEMITIIIALMIFSLYWNGLDTIDNIMIRLLGIGFFFVAILDTGHAISLKGMGILSLNDPNISTQLWIAARIMQSITIFLAIFLKRAIKPASVFLIYALVTIAALISILNFSFFPDMYIEGHGLTDFKVIAEYFIITVLSLALFFLIRYRDRVSRYILVSITLVIIFSILSEFCFTLYTGVYDLMNTLSHMLKATAFFLLYKAVFVHALAEPQKVLFKELLNERDILKKGKNIVEEELTRITAGFNNLLENLPQSIFIKDINSRYISCNKNYADHCGIDQNDIHGKDDYDFHSKNQADFYVEKDLEVFNKGTSISTIKKLISDGEEIWIQSIKSPIKLSNGKIIGLIGIFWDITEHKNKEVELTKIIERSPIVTVLWQNKENWPIEIISSNAFKVLGYSAEEFLNNTVLFTNIIHPDDIQLVADEVKINSKNGNSSFIHTPYRIILKNGEIKWIRDLTNIRRDRTGEITHYEGILLDITDLKHTEDELSKYFHAVESSPSSIIITNHKGTIEYANPKFTQITGFPKEEAIGKNLNILSSGVQDNNFYKSLWDTILSGQEWRGIFCNKKKNGEIFWEKASISSIKDDKNKIIGFIGIKEDITLEREKEEKERYRMQQQIKYRTVLFKLSQMLFEDLETGLKAITESMAIFLEARQVSIWKFTEKETELECVNLYSESGHTKGHRLEKSSHPVFFKIIKSSMFITEKGAANKIIFNQLIKEGCILPDVESFIIFPLFIMGNQIGVLSVQQIKDKRSWTDKDQNFIASIASIISTLFETFERVEAEKKLVVAVEESKRANRVKSDFLANMSHEIRTPMNAILGFSQILLNRIESEEEKGFVESINSSGKHLLTLINDILDLSKVEAGKTDILFEKCNFHELIENLENMFLIKLKETEVTLDINVDSEIPENLLLDEDRLKQVLINLIGNAVKFTKSGTIKISSFFSFTDKNKESVLLTIDIDDTGIGIPQNEWENIFNPFDQTKEGAKSEYSGTGLGLAITRKLVNLMDGNVHVVKKNGPGTLFRVSLNKVLVGKSPTLKDEKPVLKQEINKSNTPHNIIDHEIFSETRIIMSNQLIQLLKGENLATCNTLIKKLSMQKAKMFANDITELGNEYKISILSDWAKYLSKTVISFKKDDIIEILNTFPVLIERIEKLHELEE